MKNQQKATICRIVNDLLSGHNFYVGKTRSIKQLVRSIHNIPNSRILEETLKRLNCVFKKPVKIVLQGDGIPLFLQLIITVFADNEIEMTEENLDFLIEEMQSRVFLRYEDFYLTEHYLTIAKIKLFLNGKIDEYELLFDEITAENLIERHSRAEKLLLSDNSGVYPLMDNETKRNYRKKVSDLSDLLRIPEERVAEDLLITAGKRHIGFSLFDHPVFKKRKRETVLCYKIFLFTLTPLLSLILFFITENALVSLFSVLLFFKPVKQLVDRIFSEFCDPIILPRINLQGKIPKTAATAIVVSAMLNEDFSFEVMKEKLLLEYERAPKGEISFVLLCDLYESGRKKQPEDDVLIEKAEKMINELNREINDRAVFLLRRRTYSETMRKYIGHNRKRGAITDLCEYICGKDIPFRKTFGNVSLLREIKYLILLDQDTECSIGSVEKLISTLCHPYNRANVKNGKLVSGRGIISAKMTVSRRKTGGMAFPKLFCGGNGVSHYNQLQSNIGNDLLGTSPFCGKGIVDVSAFREMTEDLFKDEEVLSHDVLEGLLLNSATATDIVFYEGFPKSFDSFMKRNDRWIRGDAQNLPFVLKTVKNRYYRKQINPLSISGKLKLIENAYRAIYPAIVLTMLVFCYFLYSYKARALFFSVIISYLFSYIPGAFGCLKLSLCEFVFQPIYAFYNVKALVTGLYRIIHTKQNLLEWQTALSADRSPFKKNLCLPSFIMGAFFLTSFKPFLRIVGLMFLSSIFVIKLFQKEEKKEAVRPSREEAHFLLEEASKIWSYFSRFVGEDSHHLPPDNITCDSGIKVDRRTSPTNIGLYLLSVYGAYKLGFIEKAEMIRRINNTVDTLEKLPKYNGHLYNWYNVETLSVIKPEFISSVDSGNLIACLSSLSSVLDENTARRIREIINKTEWSFLYNNDKKLFATGFDVENKKRTRSNYDMLMSECRTLSFMKVSDGALGAEHWQNLSRRCKRIGKNFGCLSFSGTAFEYFMPMLFMPVYEDSFIETSLKFALGMNKRAGRKNSLPFGVSESAYFEFDERGSYKYKAHGIESLAVGETGSDRVISPYSDFLMMQLSFKDCYKNFEKMKKLPLSGEFGLYEAVDFSGEKPKIVKSYMSHHMGMSFLSMVNVLCERAIEKSFMKNPKHRAAEELLCENAVFVK